MTKRCIFCGTRQASIVHHTGISGAVCERCVLLISNSGGPQTVSSIPPIASSAAPDFVAHNQQILQPLTPEEFDFWVERNGCLWNDNKERLRHSLISKKIERWFEEKGGSVPYFAGGPVNYEILLESAMHSPPTDLEVAENAELITRLVRDALFGALPVVSVSSGKEDCRKEPPTKRRPRCKEIY